MNMNKKENTPMNVKKNSMIYIGTNEVNSPGYQRPIQRARIEKMAMEFDPHRMRPIEVSYRDGKYWCFDGQHRLALFKMKGIEKIPAQVHFGLTYEEEAALFAKQHDNVVRINSRDMWNAGNAAGAEMGNIVELKKIVGDYGYRIDTSNYEKLVNTFTCISSLVSGHKRCGAKGVKTMLNVLDGAWHGCTKATSAVLVNGLFNIYETYGDSVDYDRLTNELKKHTPSSFIRDSQDEIGAGPRGVKVARHMVRVYNGRLKKNRINPEKIKG